MLRQIVAAPVVDLDESAGTTVKFSNEISQAHIATVREARTKADSMNRIRDFSVLQRCLYPLRPNLLHLHREE